MPDEVQEYRIHSTSLQSAQVEDIEISKTPDGTRRKVLRALIVRNNQDASRSVKAAIICQRRSQQVGWEDIDGVPLTSLHAGETSKLLLDSAETFALVNRLNDLYGIDQDGVMNGRRVINIANEDAVIETDEGRARILRKIAEHEQLDDLASISTINGMTASEAFAVSTVIAGRKQKINQFDEMLTGNHSEHEWQEFLKENKWVFGIESMEVIDESRLSIHHDTDIPYQVTGGFMDIVELKLPTHEFWKKTTTGELFLYRNKFPVESNEVANGLSQLRNYILEAEKKVNDVDFIRDHNGVSSTETSGDARDRQKYWLGRC